MGPTKLFAAVLLSLIYLQGSYAESVDKVVDFAKGQIDVVSSKVDDVSKNILKKNWIDGKLYDTKSQLKKRLSGIGLKKPRFGKVFLTKPLVGSWKMKGLDGKVSSKYSDLKGKVKTGLFKKKAMFKKAGNSIEGKVSKLSSMRPRFLKGVFRSIGRKGLNLGKGFNTKKIKIGGPKKFGRNKIGGGIKFGRTRFGRRTNKNKESAAEVADVVMNGLNLLVNGTSTEHDLDSYGAYRRLEGKRPQKKIGGVFNKSPKKFGKKLLFKKGSKFFKKPVHVSGEFANKVSSKLKLPKKTFRNKFEFNSSMLREVFPNGGTNVRKLKESLGSRKMKLGNLGKGKKSGKGFFQKNLKGKLSRIGKSIKSFKKPKLSMRSSNFSVLKDGKFGQRGTARAKHFASFKAPNEASKRRMLGAKKLKGKLAQLKNKLNKTQKNRYVKRLRDVAMFKKGKFGDVKKRQGRVFTREDIFNKQRKLKADADLGSKLGSLYKMGMSKKFNLGKKGKFNLGKKGKFNLGKKGKFNLAKGKFSLGKGKFTLGNKGKKLFEKKQLSKDKTSMTERQGKSWASRSYNGMYKNVNRNRSGWGGRRMLKASGKKFVNHGKQMYGSTKGKNFSKGGLKLKDYVKLKQKFAKLGSFKLPSIKKGKFPGGLFKSSESKLGSMSKGIYGRKLRKQVGKSSKGVSYSEVKRMKSRKPGMKKFGKSLKGKFFQKRDGKMSFPRPCKGGKCSSWKKPCFGGKCSGWTVPCKGIKCSLSKPCKGFKCAGKPRPCDYGKCTQTTTTAPAETTPAATDPATTEAATAVVGDEVEAESTTTAAPTESATEPATTAAPTEAATEPATTAAPTEAAAESEEDTTEAAAESEEDTTEGLLSLAWKSVHGVAPPSDLERVVNLLHSQGEPVDKILEDVETFGDSHIPSVHVAER